MASRPHFTRTPMTEGSPRCASTGNAETPRITAATTRPSSTSPIGCGEAALQQQRVQPSAVLEADRGQPARVDEAAMTVQRKRCVGIVVHNDGDDLSNPGIRAADEYGIEQATADSSTDSLG